MDLVKLLYKACIEFSEIKISLLLNEPECKKECERNYPTLKIFINNLKDKIDEIENLIEKYYNDEKIDSIEKLVEKYVESIIETIEKEKEELLKIIGSLKVDNDFYKKKLKPYL